MSLWRWNLPSFVSPRLRGALKLAVAAGVLALVLRMVDSTQVISRLRDVQLGWIALALLLLTLQTILSALRWQRTAARLGNHMGLWLAVREYFLAQALNLALPGGVVGDVGRALRASASASASGRGSAGAGAGASAGAGIERAGQAVVFERLAGQAPLLGVTLLGVVLVTVFPSGMVVPPDIQAGLLASFAAVALCAALFAFSGERWPPVAKWRRAAGHAVFAPGIWPWQLGLSLGTVAANLLAFAACAAAVGVWLSPMAIMVVLPLVLFAMVLPLTIGGWGFREGAAVALFPLAGATGAEGFAASACFGLVFMLSAFSGLLLFLVPKRG